jgi:hypothetical protein
MSQHFAQAVPFHVREAEEDGIYGDICGGNKEALQRIDVSSGDGDPEVEALFASIEAGEQAQYYERFVKNFEKEMLDWVRNQTGWAYDGEAYRHGITD